MSLQPIFPPKPSDIFSPAGGWSEGLDAFRFFLNIVPEYEFYVHVFWGVPICKNMKILKGGIHSISINFPCSADHEQDWQPYPVDPYSVICDDHTYIHKYIQVYPGHFYCMRWSSLVEMTGDDNSAAADAVL